MRPISLYLPFLNEAHPDAKALMEACGVTHTVFQRAGEYPEGSPELEGYVLTPIVRLSLDHEREGDEQDDAFTIATRTKEHAEELVGQWNVKWDGDYEFTINE